MELEARYDRAAKTVEIIEDGVVTHHADNIGGATEARAQLWRWGWAFNTWTNPASGLGYHASVFRADGLRSNGGTTIEAG